MDEEKSFVALEELIRERQGTKTLAGLNNQGQVVVKNRAYRRKVKTLSQLEGKTKNYYTKKKTKKRTRNGKIKIIRKRK